MIGQKPPESFVRAATDGRHLQANPQRTLPFAIDYITTRAWLHTYQKAQSLPALANLDQRTTCLAPNSAVPTRICVAPSSMAISKSRDIPIDSSGRGQSISAET